MALENGGEYDCICWGGGAWGQEGKYMNYRNMEMVNSGMFLMDIFTSKVNWSFHFHQHFLQPFLKVRIKMPYSEPSHNNRKIAKLNGKYLPQLSSLWSVSFKFVLQPNYNLLHVRDLQFVQGHPNCKIWFTKVFY